MASDLTGDWWVDVTDERPTEVRMRFEELDIEHGVFTHEIYLPPDTAEHMAAGLMNNAKVARTNL